MFTFFSWAMIVIVSVIGLYLSYRFIKWSWRKLRGGQSTSCVDLIILLLVVSVAAFVGWGFTTQWGGQSVAEVFAQTDYVKEVLTLAKEGWMEVAFICFVLCITVGFVKKFG